MKAVVASVALRAVASTWRIHIQGNMPQAPCIIAFWHGEMLPIWYAMRVMRPVALVSNSNDGDYLARLLHDWRYTVIRGSTSKGGGEALHTMVEYASSGRAVLVTPDGPRGPAHEMKAGAVVAAQRAQVPLVLARAYTHNAKTFHRSWDNFQLPMPFSHTTVHVSHEEHIPIGANREQIAGTIELMEERLNKLGSIVC